MSSVKIRIAYAPQTKPDRRMTVIGSRGTKVSMYTMPPEFDFEHVPSFGTVEREGKTSITRMVNPGLRELSFKHMVANLSFQRNIQKPIWDLQKLIRSGQKVRFVGGSDLFSGALWYHVTGFKIEAQQLSGHNQISRAMLHWTLREAVDSPSLIRKRNTKKAKPKKRKPSKKKPKKAVQRTYKVKRGDSYYKIAQKQLGRGSRWPEIWKLNKKSNKKFRNPNRLMPGWVLKMPKK